MIFRLSPLFPLLVVKARVLEDIAVESKTVKAKAVEANVVKTKLVEPKVFVDKVLETKANRVAWLGILIKREVTNHKGYPTEIKSTTQISKPPVKDTIIIEMATKKQIKL